MSKKLIIATQGQAASFHYQASELFFPDAELAMLGFDTFTEVFETLASGQADYGVVAIENSIHGAITESYDLLDQYHLSIVGEQYLHIGQNIIGLPGASLAEATDVYSHFAALSQSRAYLDAHLPHLQRHVHPDTAGAVADIKKWDDPRKLAIASAFAAAHYELPILAANIEADRRNYTRFALLSRDHHVPADASKTSLLLQLHGHPGALHEVLGILARHQLDLTMLISRPIVGKPGDYQFYIDVGAAATEVNFQVARDEIVALGCQMRVLGSYKPLNTLSALDQQVTADK